MVRCVRGGVDHVCEGEGVSDGCVNSLVLDCFAQWVLYAGPSVTVVDLSELVKTSLTSGI